MTETEIMQGVARENALNWASCVAASGEPISVTLDRAEKFRSYIMGDRMTLTSFSRSEES
jgi:hypothetical protein